MPDYILPAILSLSIILQIASAVTAISLVRTSGYYKPWIFIATAILLMAIRRITSFLNMLQTGLFPPSSFLPELIALFISILMLIGLLLFRPVFLDIRSRHNKSERKIEQQDITLRESNHRIKNNLLMVSSLIKLKASSIDKDVNLADLIHQIDTIRVLHKKLYQTEDMYHIDLRVYLCELLEGIFASYKKVSLDIEMDDISINSRMAVPLGLIVNEIATNAVKYGFTDYEEARFSVDMRKDADSTHYILTLSNTGNPFPEEIGLENPETMGLQLISTLVAQLSGTIELQKKPNPVFTIRFPVGEE